MASSPSTPSRKQVVNLRAVDLIMDDRGDKDRRYYCLPPVYGKPATKTASGGYPLHLVSQGHTVGVFYNWLEAKAQLTGFHNSSNRGYHTMDECVEAWQALCCLGLHPHPVDPAYVTIPPPQTTPFVNTSARKSTPKTAQKNSGYSPVKREKREGTPGASTAGNAQLLADLNRYCRPILDDAPSGGGSGGSPPPIPTLLNFAIRGGGIVSSSALRSQDRYLEMQRRGEEPDMPVTRSLAAASLFALDNDEEDSTGFGTTVSSKRLHLPLPDKMGRKGAAARKRACEGLAPVKPGKIGWVHGTKLPFFEAHKDEYLAAAEIKKTGDFYDQIAQLYLGKYGFNTAFEGDLPEGEDVADDVDPDEDPDSLTPEEAEERAGYFKKVRGKIAVWYKAQYGGAVEKKMKPKNFKQLFNKPELAPPAPVKPRELHWYSHHFYTERIRPRVEARWAAVSRRPNPPAIIKVRNAVTKEAWLSETEEFKAEVRSALDAAHSVALEAYGMATSGEVPTTPHEYDVALNNAAYYLQPFVDAAAERFGMNVVFLMCGPVANRGGRIEVRSVHSGMLNGLVPRIWSDFDRAGFDGAQRSFIDFTHHCFTEAQCRARALDGMAMAAEDLNHMSAAGGLSSRGDGDGDAEAGGAGNEAGPASSAAGPSGDGEQTQQPLPGSDGLYLDPRNDPIFDDPMFMQDLFTIPTGPVIGRALQQELDALSPEAREEEMLRFGWMSEESMEIENNHARNRVALARMAAGMDVSVALAVTSDDEEDETPERTPTSSTTGTGWSKGTMPATPVMMQPITTQPRAPTATSVAPTKTSTSAGSSGGTPTATPRSAPATTTPMLYPAPRPAFGINAVLQRPEENPEAEGPLNSDRPAPQPAPATSTPALYPAPRPAFGINAVLQRPEENPAAEGPLNSDRPASQPAFGINTVLQRPEENPAAEGPLNSNEREGREAGEQILMWRADDESKWQAELRSAVQAFGRATKLGSKGCVSCVEQLIELERAWKFPGKGLLAALQGGPDERPREVPDFMQVTLSSAVGPREVDGSFAQRWWNWWGVAQPEGREVDGELQAPEELEVEEWAEVAMMHGRNGMLLYVGALLWWGEAAAAEEDVDKAAVLRAEWRTVVAEVTGVLRAAVASVGAKKSTAKAKGKGKADAKAPSASKRKRADTNLDVEKENDPPQQVS
ncbi:hypothetical protein C8F04DRAFT_1187135 [Mycena alexandri]|uniref:Ribonuclease H1 N-terminal domain-containing protein n=1 Tax=Mycena alexandri TaxID=1745969 RepID=A0AAD6X071_9AGAR|nr:hypothetical protein C8F04DRAFT_1187135 [Mycena alexandri]